MRNFKILDETDKAGTNIKIAKQNVGKSPIQKKQDLRNSTYQPSQEYFSDSMNITQPKQKIKTGETTSPKCQHESSGVAFRQSHEAKSQVPNGQQHLQNGAYSKESGFSKHIRAMKAIKTEKEPAILKKQNTPEQKLSQLKNEVPARQNENRKNKGIKNKIAMPKQNGNARAANQQHYRQRLKHQKQLFNGNSTKLDKAAVKRAAETDELKENMKKPKIQNKQSPIREIDLADGSSSDTNSIAYIKKHLQGFVHDDEYMQSSDDDDEDYSDGNYSTEVDEDFSSTTDDSEQSSLDECFEYSSTDSTSIGDDDEYLNCLNLTDEDSNDEDYKLPEHVLDDLIIHRGTATLYDIPKGDQILLDSDTENSHIVDCPQTVVKSVKQYESYSLTSLKALNEANLMSCPTFSYHNMKTMGNRADVMHVEALNECPSLVPLSMSDRESSDYEDVNNFGELYEHLSGDDDSIITVDVNEKYISYGEISSVDSDTDIDEECINDQSRTMSAKIVQAKQLPIAPKPFLDELETSLPSNTVARDFVYEQLECVVLKIPVFKTEQTTPDLNIPSACTENHLTKSATMHCDELIDDPAIDGTLDNGYVASSAMSNRNIFCTALTSNDVLLLLEEPISIYGTLHLTLLCGTVEVYGHMPLLNKRLDIYSPRGCSLTSITPDHQQQPLEATSKQQLTDILAAFNKSFTQTNLQLLCQHYTPGVSAVLLLQRNVRAKKLVSNFKKFMSENIFPNMNSSPSDRLHHASEYLLQCIINGSNTNRNQNDGDKCLKIPREWESLTLSTKTKMLITGGKAVGKSTLLRYMVNRHIHQFPRILLIDLDIGQSELFVPQTISCTVLTEPLLGPGFFLIKQPDRAYIVGHVNIAQCATTYMRAVQELLAYCYEQPAYANIPWLVNTMGYNKGFGLELVACISDHLNPTDIVQLQSKKNINNFDMLLHRASLRTVNRMVYASEEFNKANAAPMASCQLHIIDSAVLQESRFQRDGDMSAKDLRYALLIARFSDPLHGSAEWLTDCVPLSTSIDELHLVDMLDSSSTQDELFEAIECNLVYLCKIDVNSTDAPFECYGIGVVRGIDRCTNQIYVVPAINYDNLEFVNCLALGQMPMPNSMFVNQGPKIRGYAPFVCNTVNASSSKAIKQIYHRPGEFLTGEHRQV